MDQCGKCGSLADVAPSCIDMKRKLESRDQPFYAFSLPLCNCCAEELFSEAGLAIQLYMQRQPTQREETGIGPSTRTP